MTPRPGRALATLGTALALLCAPPVLGAAPQADVTREAAERRIAELEAAPEVDESQRAGLVELYRQVLVQLDAELASEERAQAYQQAIETAPDEAAGLRAQLEAARAAPAAPITRPPDATAGELDQQLIQLQAELAAQRATESDLARRVAAEFDRPEEAGEQLATARSDLEQLGPKLDEPESAQDAPESERAARWVLVARQRARTAEVAMLEQELLSHPVRLELLEARRDVAAWEISQLEDRVARVEGWISELRQAEAESARLEAERLRGQVTGKHPLIQRVAADIAQTTRERELLIPRIDQANAKRVEVEAQLEQTEEDYRETTRSLELGITRSLGTVLLELRRKLPNARSFRRAKTERSREATAERLKLFQIERELRELAEPEQALDGLMADESARDLSGAERAEVRAELEQLLVTKREHLEALEESRHDFLIALGTLEMREGALLARAAELAEILDERLLWIPNAPRIDAALWRLRADLGWLTSVSLWRDVVSAGLTDLRRVYSGCALAGLAIAGLLLSRRRMRARLETIAAKVGNVRADGVLLTLQALLIQLLNTLPVPAAGVFLGWRLMRAPESTETTKAVGAGLVTAFAAGFVLQLLRNLCRSDGVAIRHFGWRPRTGRLVRRHLLWYLAIALPTAFLVVLTQRQSDALVRYSLGALAFVVLTIATAVLAFFLLHPKVGLFTGGSVGRSGAWLRRTRFAWLPAGVGVPATLAAMASAGYYYAAQQLGIRLIGSLLIILAAVFVHAFLLRWLLVSQRRLAMKVAMEKRAALIKSREAGESEADLEASIEPPEEIDVAVIKDQTHDLLRVSIGFLLVVALWFAWVSVLPALSVLDDVTLWHHSVVVDGRSLQKPITLASLGLALLIVLITITAARNMPGFLEIAILPAPARRRRRALRDAQPRPLRDRGDGHRPGLQRHRGRLVFRAVAGGRPDRRSRFRPAGDLRELRVRSHHPARASHPGRRHGHGGRRQRRRDAHPHARHDDHRLETPRARRTQQELHHGRAHQLEPLRSHPADRLRRRHRLRFRHRARPADDAEGLPRPPDDPRASRAGRLLRRLRGQLARVRGAGVRHRAHERRAHAHPARPAHGDRSGVPRARDHDRVPAARPAPRVLRGGRAGGADRVRVAKATPSSEGYPSVTRAIAWRT